METNRYYTPKVEEFHVGFEFEVLQFLGEPIFDKVNGSVDLSTVEHTWIQQKIKFLSDVSENFCVIYSGGEKIQESIGNSIRVKYLDREDIESLGFKETSNKYFKKDALPSMGYWLNIVLDLRFGWDDVTIRGTRGTTEEGYLFRGSIKNKSELRKLMLQLNILEDEK